MTASTVGFMILGAVLVLAGVLGGALADRIRGGARRAERPSSGKRPSEALPDDRARGKAIGKGATSDPPRTVEADMAGEVELALTGMGYSKAEAAAAVAACPATDRHTLENWIRCALRRTLAKRTH